MSDEGVLDLANFDFPKKTKDPIEQYVENLGEPLWHTSFDLAGHDIVLINYNPDFELTEGHATDILDLGKRIEAINPDILKHLKRIIFDPTQPTSRYNDEKNHPPNGTITSDGIILFKNGQRRDITHRTGVTNNFQGTLSHEAFHFENKEVDSLWKKEFGWDYCSQHPELWEKVDTGRTTFKNRQTGAISLNGTFTSRPEECVTDYARQAWDDDYADSGVVALFDKPKLEALNPRKVEIIERKNPAKTS
jgi:hypothetical protein